LFRWAHHLDFKAYDLVAFCTQFPNFLTVECYDGCLLGAKA
jgi:hypothetical protein